MIVRVIFSKVREVKVVIGLANSMGILNAKIPEKIPTPASTITTNNNAIQYLPTCLSTFCSYQVSDHYHDYG
ncbi:hypothetical protein CO611_05315 [Lysobacteraceae bacterium NML03-0222]|nr:hypothetical protein CO611_05315 [Xanthomonadaceae bacterium NML03-0222]